MPRPSYRALLRLPGVPGLYVLSFFARIPHAMSGLVLTLHVVGPLHRGYAQAGIATAAATVGMALGGPWRGRLVDRYGLRRAILPSVLVESVVWICAPRLGFEALVVAAFVGGLFLVPVFPVTRQSLSVLVPVKLRQAAYALDSAGTEATFMLAPVVAVMVSTRFSTSVALVTLGLATAVAGLGLIWANPPTRSAGADRSAAAVAEAWRPGTELIVVLLAALAASVVLVGTDLALVATLNDAGRTADVGWMIAVWACGSLVGALVYGRTRRSPSPLVLVAVLSAVTVPVAFVHGPLALAVLVFIAGLPCAPTLSTINARLVTIVPESRRGEVIGWASTVQTVANAMGAPVIGVALDLVGPAAGFLLAAALGVLVVVSGWAALWLRARTHRGQPAQPVDVDESALEPALEIEFEEGLSSPGR
ncbi:MAG: MFS transporter [Cellulomonas sp.]|nr:MFS transporter [Cellulomonas sp.]